MRILKIDRKWNKYTLISILGITLLLFSMFLSIAGAAPFAYIPNTGDNTLSVIDTSTDTIYKTIGGFESIDNGIAVSPDGKAVYVTNFNSSKSINNVSVINTTENEVTGTLQLGFEPRAIAVSPDGKKLYITLNEAKLAIVNITDADHYDVNNIELGGYPTGVTVSPDGTRVYVANYCSDDQQLKGNVSIINTTDNSLISTVEVEPIPYGIAVSPDGKKVYVTSMNLTGFSNYVSVINTTDNNVTSIEVGVTSSGVTVSPDGTRVYVVNSNIGWSPLGNSSVSVIDTTAEQYSVITNVSVGWGAVGISVTPDGKKVYVPNYINNTVSVIDTANNTVIATVPVGDTPIAFGQFIGPDLSAQPVMPVANFTANVTSGDVPFGVQFTDASTGTVSSYAWDFDNDGVIDSTEQSPSYIYSTPGTYTVNLTVANAGGNDSEIKTYYIIASAPETPDTIKPVIVSAVLFPVNATTGSTITISVNATDNVEVTGITADNVTLFKGTEGIWLGSITAPSSVGSYTLQINASDAAGNAAETSAPYNVVQLSGSSSIAVSPKISNVTAGSNVSPAIIVKNALIIDDTFKVWISVSELPASSQANLTWFGWTEQEVKLRYGEEVSIPVTVNIPTGTAAGRKLFRANVKSEATGISGFNTGYLTIT
jgi:YVTN family beta-propeller protein